MVQIHLLSGLTVILVIVFKTCKYLDLLICSVLGAGAPAAAIVLSLLSAATSVITFYCGIRSEYLRVPGSIPQSESSLKTKHWRVLLCASISLPLIAVNVAFAIFKLVHLDHNESHGLSDTISAVSNLSLWVFCWFSHLKVVLSDSSISFRCRFCVSAFISCFGSFLYD